MDLEQNSQKKCIQVSIGLPSIQRHGLGGWCASAPGGSVRIQEKDLSPYTLDHTLRRDSSSIIGTHQHRHNQLSTISITAPRPFIRPTKPGKVTFTAPAVVIRVMPSATIPARERAITTR